MTSLILYKIAILTNHIVLKSLEALEFRLADLNYWTLLANTETFLCYVQPHLIEVNLANLTTITHAHIFQTCMCTAEAATSVNSYDEIVRQ